MPPKRYQKKDPIEHVLTRPDMYVGSTRAREINEYIGYKENDKYKIMYDTVKFSPAILRIFVEALSNAIDNVERSKKTKTPCTKIKISINEKTGETSIWNDGDIVPVEIDKDEKCYIHSMIFGQLLTGSNYDDEEERIISGRNGIGIKAVNIFSKIFRVTGCDPVNEKILVQEWNNNMKNTKGPVVKNTKLKKGYTEVMWIPDFNIFDLDCYTKDITRLYTRYVLDAAMLSKIDVYLNDELLQIHNISDYSLLYHTLTEEKLHIKTKTSEILLTPAKEYQSISFVNGIYTRFGGQHVDSWTEALFRPIVDKFNGKDKKTKTKTPKININDVKQFFRIIVVSTVIRPEFNGQNKEKLESPQVEAEVKRTHITAICKWSVMDRIEDIIRSKEMVVLKKAEKVTKKTKIEGYDPANKAGGKDSMKCSLFITEGLSAKTYVVAGIKVGVYGRTGRDWNGILPVRGKILNVKDKAPNIIAENKVICSLIHALGLKHGLDYTDDNNFKKLHYGKLFSVTDADCFTKDTPLLIKTNQNIDIITCENLYKMNNPDSLQIWSQKGWTNIKAVKKKESNKKIIQITTSCGLVRCTEDHKMILENGDEILARQLKQGDCLLRTRRIEKPIVKNTDNISDIQQIMHDYQCYKKTTARNIKDMEKVIENEGYFCNPIDLTESNYITEEEAFVWGIFFAQGTCDIYTFIKDRNTQTVKNTEKSRKRWLEWVEKYENRLVQLSIKPILTKNEKKLLSEEMFLRNSNQKNEELWRTSYSWNISNCDIELLEKCYDIMIKIYPEHNWSIIESKRKDEKHQTPYKLILNGGKKTQDFISKFRKMFYDLDNSSHKKVPTEILNSTKNIQQSFLNGYYDGDGFRHLKRTKNAMGFDILGQIGAQGMCFILERLGFCVNIHNRKRDIFTIHFSNRYRRLYPGKIKDIKHIMYDDDVYDIETENHQLNVGIGGLVVHNCDGIHIEGLLMNFLHTLYPTLLEREESFFISLKTPIARVKQPKTDDMLFYDENNFKEWLTQQTKKVDVKYYKGLGTTRSEDVPDTFGKKLVEFVHDEKSNDNMHKAFNKKHADLRKQWLADYIPGEKKFLSLDNMDSVSKMDISSFIDGELIKFSHADCTRSIPNGIDGLKESQRKILYAVKKRKLKYSGKSLKVAQLGGYTAEHSNYHHGENNLFDTIIGMAHEYPGTNNIPILYRDGQFGCLDPETPVLLWNSNIKMAKDITIEDKLIGDDGTPRSISKLINGVDKMFLVEQEYGSSYTVNSCHILTLKYSAHKSIRKCKYRNCWILLYFDKEPKFKSIRFGHSKTLDKAYEEICLFKDTIPDNNIFDINIRDFLEFSNYQKKFFKSVKNNTSVKWEPQPVKIEPYILGMWLGDGDKTGKGFSSEDADLLKEWVKYVEKIDCDIVHTTDDINNKNYHYSIRRKGSNKLHPDCDWVYDIHKDNQTECNSNDDERYDENPFKEILKEMNLLNNKHIPIEYILNSEDVRINILAGIIDRDGYVKTSGNGIQHIEIKTHYDLLISIQYIARSLGYTAELSIKDHTQNSEYISSMGTVIISGEELYKIPTKLQHKKLYNIKCIRNRERCNIKVTPLGIGEYVGWHIDKNERFLLGDFTVTHNTRLENGDDAAAARYIYTKMDVLTELIFREEDEPILTQVNDDGDLVQPIHYVPIIPMILINGCIGIGTGWSCNIPCFNPLDMIEAIKIWIKNDGEVLNENPDLPGTTISMFPEFIPWYRGFKGDIVKNTDTRFITYGIVEKTGRETVQVKELPIGMWTSKFADFLDDLHTDKKLKSISNYSTPKDVHFSIVEGPEFVADVESLKLHSYLYTSNMVIFNEKEQLRKIDTVDEIIDTFCKVRYEFYIIRKKHQINVLETELKFLGNKERFISEIVNNTLNIMNIKEEIIIQILKDRKYDEDPKKNVDEGGYDYLLRIPIRNLTSDKVRQLKDDIESKKLKLDDVMNITVEEIWLKELDEFENAYKKWLVEIDNISNIKTKTQKKK